MKQKIDDMIKLSIIVPFYNVEPLIEQCIRSLYNQDISDDEFEVICINDLSPDNSLLILEKLQKEFSNLRIICHNKNKRLGGARNTGINAARGKYIWFVDSDDYVQPNCFGFLLDKLEKDSLDYIMFGWERYDDENKIFLCEDEKYISETELSSGPDLFFNKDIPWIKQISACNKIYRRSFILCNNLFFLENIMYEDNDFSFRVVAYAKRCKFINKKPYVYRIYKSSETQRPANAKRLIFFERIWLQLINISSVLENIDFRFKKVITEFICNSLNRFYIELSSLNKNDKRYVINSIKKKEWIKVYCFLPLKLRLKILYKYINHHFVCV